MPRPKAERIERWTCGACGVACERPIARGQRPKWCDDCRRRTLSEKIYPACGQAGVRRDSQTCSWICGTFLRNGYWPGSLIPESHPSRSTHVACLVPSGHPSRSTRVPADHPSRQVPVRDCAECDQEYTSNQPAQSYCTARCAKRAGRRRRRGREYGDGGSFRWTEVIRLFLAFGRCCAYCGAQVLGEPDPDHVVPLSRGGQNTISNVLPACRACNCDKRDLTLDEWAADRARRGKSPVVTTWAIDDPRYTHLALRAASPKDVTAA